MEKRFKFRYVNEITGLFVLVVLALLVAGVVMSERSQHWFARKFAFEVLLPAQGSFGLKSGNQVYILGIDVGAVDHIHVEENGQMRARIRIQSDFERFVRQDSVATIKKTFGVAGDSFVEITKGSGAPLPKKDPTIVCLSSDELPGMMEKLLDELRREIVPVLQKGGESLDAWTSLATNINQTQADLRQLVTRLDRLAAGLEQGRGTAGKLLTEDALINDLQRLLAESRDLLAKGNASLNHLEGAMKNLQQGTARLPEIGDAVATEVKDLPGLVMQTQQTLHELGRLVEGLQRHWLVRKYIEPEDTSGARIPPGEVRGGKP